MQGSRRTPYVVSTVIDVPEPREHQWHRSTTPSPAKVGFVARLLNGEVPPDLEGVFTDAGVALFPATLVGAPLALQLPRLGEPLQAHRRRRSTCSPTSSTPTRGCCSTWRGRSRDQILERFRACRDEVVIEEVAPWWPFAPGPLPPLAGEPPSPDRDSAGPDEADLVLDALEPLDVLIGKTPLVELLRPVYNHIVARDPDPAV